MKIKTQSRIEQLFNQEQAKIAYLTAGDGGIKRSLESARALLKGGVNMLEIGVPFSDPVADGPVIQRAHTRALQADTRLVDILDLVREIRSESDIPIILFSYLSPILAPIGKDFLADAKQAGVDGLLVVDCPLEESQGLRAACKQHDIAVIQVVSSATSKARLQQIVEVAQGFIYYACRKGTTGMKHELPEDFNKKIQMIKSIAGVPVVVGFGISNRQMVEQVLMQADGAVIGSLFVKMIEEGAVPDDLMVKAQTLFARSS